jgi:hypothetical protein
MGRGQGGPSRTGSRSGAYLKRYVTDDQRRRRPIFMDQARAAFGLVKGEKVRMDESKVSAT